MSTVPSVIQTYIDGLKAHDVQKIAETVSDDLAFVSAARTLDKPQFLSMLRALYTGFPDWHYDHDEPTPGKGVVTIRWRQGGTHTGSFDLPGLDPIPATGREVQIPEHDFFYTVAGNQIIQIRPDPVPGGAPGGILEQIGVATPPL